MKTKEAIAKAVSDVLYQIRIKNNLSKTKIAALIGVDKHTWMRWESGESSPGIADIIMIFDTLNEPILRPLLDILYPSDDRLASDTMRKDAAEYYIESATDHQVRVWDYMMHAIHGSEIASQIEEFCAIDHMPMQYRYFLAEQVYVFYMMARSRGELIHTDEAMPDMDIFVTGLKKSQKAAFDKLKS